MHRPRRRLDRLVLLAYPRSFRRDYGDEITRTIDDLRRHGGARGWRLGLRLTGDVLATAPRLRLESAMTRHRATTVVALVVGTVVAAMIGSPIVLLALGLLVAGAIVTLRRHDRPLHDDTSPTRRWTTWAAAGVASFGVGIVVAAGDDDGELSEPVWALWAVTWLAGTAMLALALVLAVARLAHRRVV